MATFTSKASGLASASGQTTWNEAGTPTTGDTIVDSHGVTYDYAVTLAAITFGSAAIDKTFTLQAAITVTGDATWQSSTTGQYDATRYNTLHFASGGKLILRPASGQTKGFIPATVAKFRLTGDVWIEFDDSDGGVAAYMARGGVGFGQNFRTCLLDCTSLTLINMGTDSEFGGNFNCYGASNLSVTNVSCDHSSLNIKTNAFFGYSGVLTVDKVAIDTPSGVGGLSEGLSINVASAVVSRIVSKNAFCYVATTAPPNRIVEYNDFNNGFPFTIAAVGEKYAAILDAAIDNPHLTLPAGDKVYLECPRATLPTDPGDLYPAANQTNTRLLLPPIRTGTQAGKSPWVIHIITGADVDFTLENSVVAAENLLSAIYSGEDFSEGSAANKIASVRNNIFFGDSWLLRDLFATPATDAYPAAAFHHNLLDTNLSTGPLGLGIHSSIASSGGTYNANGQTRNGIDFNEERYFATWAETQNGTETDANGIALLLADPSLVDDLFDYLYGGWLCTNAEAHGTAEGGGDMGIGYVAASTGRRGMNHRLLRPY